MKKKYYNEAIIGNDKIVASFSSKGEMLRLFYPTRDCRQFVDEMLTGVKINDSMLIYLQDDINNQYEQYYTENTNILNTKIKNTYFNLSILQTDFVSISKDIIIKRYKFTNENAIDLNVNFLLYSNLLSSFNNMVGTIVKNDVFMQYSHNYTYCVFSKTPILSYKLNGSKNEIKSGSLWEKDYVGMSSDSALGFDVGNIKPGETKELDIFIYINNNREKYEFDEILDDVEKIKKIDVKKEENEVKDYWQKYVNKHDGLNVLKEPEKWQKLITGENEISDETYSKYMQMKNIYTRTILLFPLLSNSQTGGISAALEVDEEKDKSGRYAYCWPRDAVFITKALDLLNMKEETTKFYKIFSKNTQNRDGMWEQRFYTDCRLAPCWGYQIDETASIVYGVYEHYKAIKDINFLKDTYEMCKNAIRCLKEYANYALNIMPENFKKENENNRFATHESYDLWEMHEGIHLYSLSAIYAALDAMIKIEEELKPIIKTKDLDWYLDKIKEFSLSNFINEDSTLRRNNKDNICDISTLGTVLPFKMLDDSQKELLNTVDKMNLNLRTYTGGYIRFEYDNYMGGNNPWPIATLWMTLYDLQKGNRKEALEHIAFVTKTAKENGLLAEQIDNGNLESKWVIGLGWSHAMYILALAGLFGDGS